MRVLSALADAFSYSSATLVNLASEVLVELNGNHPDSPRLKAFAREAVESGDVQLSDLYSDPRFGTRAYGGGDSGCTGRGDLTTFAAGATRECISINPNGCMY